MGRNLRFAPLRDRETEDYLVDPERSREARYISARTSHATSLENAADFIVQKNQEKMMEIFMLSKSEVVAENSLAHYGVDSLVAVELRNFLALCAGAEVSIFDVLQSPSLESLGRLGALKSSYLPTSLRSTLT